MRIALLGYGKMGKAIEEVAKANGHDIHLTIDIDNAESLSAETINGTDVAIEFSHPDAVLKHISFCFAHNIPIVVGTTGWNDQLANIKNACTELNQTLFYASNFSLGIYIFSKINDLLADLMNKQVQYDISLEETHHTSKVDAPSGTAIKLAEDIIGKVDRKTKWSKGKGSDDESLEIHSNRENNIPGTHVVHYQSRVDDVEIIHTAHSRQGFAEGAVRAAEWVIEKKGVFTMSDLFE